MADIPFHMGGAPVCVVVCACVRAREKLCVCVHSVAWCFLNNQPTWACLVTCIHYILDFGVVKSKLKLTSIYNGVVIQLYHF